MRLAQIHSHATLLLAAAMLVLCGCSESADTPSGVKPLVSSETEDIFPNQETKTTKGMTNVQVDGQSVDDEPQRSIDRIQSTNVYTEEMLALATADVEIQVFNDTSDEITLQVWKDKWEDQVEQFRLTGGCGCCVDIYTITGPIAAIEEFPISENRRKYYPKYHTLAEDGR